MRGQYRYQPCFGSRMGHVESELSCALQEAASAITGKMWDQRARL